MVDGDSPTASSELLQQLTTRNAFLEARILELEG
jgi:hypothetical protein